MYVCSLGCLIIASWVWISTAEEITSNYNEADEKGKRPESWFSARRLVIKGLIAGVK